jgi:hypothetical protein
MRVEGLAAALKPHEFRNPPNRVPRNEFFPVSGMRGNGKHGILRQLWTTDRTC